MLAKELYSRSVKRLEKCGISNPNLDVALLLEYLFDISKVDIYISDRELVSEELEKFERAICRREAKEPLAYIVSEKEFWSLSFAVSPEVLIPRPETEILIEEVLGLVKEKETSSGQVLDLGTGSGVIAVVLALELPCYQIFTTDLSLQALRVARENVVRHGVAGRVFMMNGNWLSHVRPTHQFDMITSNPPYVALNTREDLHPELDFEPEMALFSGEDGLDSYRVIIPASRKYLKNGGRIILEIGYDQEDMVRDLFSATQGMELIRIRKDYAGLPRIAVGMAV